MLQLMTYWRRSFKANEADNTNKPIAIIRLNVLPVSKKATKFNIAIITIAAINIFVPILTLPPHKYIVVAIYIACPIW